MRQHLQPIVRPLEPERPKDERPTDHGRRRRRCQECGAYLCRYNEGDTCWSHQPQAGEPVPIDLVSA